MSNNKAVLAGKVCLRPTNDGAICGGGIEVSSGHGMVLIWKCQKCNTYACDDDPYMPKPEDAYMRELVITVDVPELEKSD